MIRFIALILIVCFSSLSAQAQKSKADLQTEINTSWPDNTSNRITPKKLRDPNLDIVNSYLDLNGASSFACSSGQVLTGFSTLSQPVCAAVSGSGITQLTGDGVAGPGTGSQTLTLATVNANVGTFGSTTQCVTLTVNAKGLITAVSQAACASGGAGTPGGSSGQIQYNNAGAFGGFTASGDLTVNTGTGVFTFGTVNANVGSFGSATSCTAFTTNAKGLITAASATTCTPAVASITGMGTGVATALAINVGTAGSFITNGGALGTPLSGVGTNLTGTAAGLTAGTASAVAVGGITGLGTGCATWLATPSSANLRGCITDEVGTGAAYFVGGALGTPASGTATNITGLVPSTGLAATGTPSATTFLRGDNSWQAPSGSGTVTSVTAGAGLTATTNPIVATGTISSYFDPGSITNCILVLTLPGNALTIDLKTQAGGTPSATAPCTISFGSATLATGDYTPVNVTAATTFALGSTGSTLGAANSTPFRVWVTAWNNAGTVVLGVSNQSGTVDVFPLDETNVQSSTACSSCTNATSAGVFYTTAAQTSKAIRILGFLEWSGGLAVAGTWGTVNSSMRMMGPGVKKPGETVRRTWMSTSTATTVAVNTPTATNVVKNFTKTSAANPVRLDMVGYGVNNTGSLAGISTRFYRGNSACTTALGFNGYGTVAAGGTSNNSLSWIDMPAASGTTSAQYTVCLAAPDSLSINFPYSGSGASFILEEIMG